MDIFSALSEPTRRSILEMLAREGSLSATKIYQNFNSSAPAISQHLKVLKEAGLVEMQKQAQQHIYKLNPDKIKELDIWVHSLKIKWEERFTALDEVLEKEKSKLKKEKNDKQ